MTETGLIHIYCGNGKGKTTAAMGLSMRCSGGGGKVMIFQFLKNNSSGERAILEVIPNITLLEGYEDTKFTYVLNEIEKQKMKEFYQKIFQEIKQKVRTEEYQLLVLDEILAAVSGGFLVESEVIEFLKQKPKSLEVVLTGRNPSEAMMEIADYISCIENVKHPYDKGIAARKLIEF